MGRTVEELKRSMSRGELTHWFAFANLEPFGPLAAYQQAGVVCSTIVNAMPFRGNDAKIFAPGDFFSVLDQEPEEDTPEQQLAKIDKILGGF
jgi:hypothetical protein